MSRLPSAALMAEARRVYVPAMAWARTHHWKIAFYRGSFGSMTRAEYFGPSPRPRRPLIAVEWWEVTGPDRQSHLRIDVAHGDRPVTSLHPASLPQAIDLLVSLGILPGQFHSLYVDMETVRHEAECDHGGRPIAADMFGAPDMFDTDGHRWMWHAAGYLREDDGTPLTRAEVIDQYGLVLEAS